MYLGFYRLKDHPFRLTPDPCYMCMTAQHREALSGLVYNICTRPGLMVLVGEAGTGKTTLLHAVSELLEKRSYLLARCNNPTLTREELYDLLLTQLGVECSSTLKSRQLRALEEHLMEKRAAGRLAVLIVDEAQRLPCELLEEIRLLLNLETPREKLLQIIMAGQPELSETLSRPELRQLKQRVSAICRLAPLHLEDLHDYLKHRLSMAGMPDQKLFPEEAMALIFKYTQGIPRLVNSLCENALQTGFALQVPQISAAIIQEAANDLELSDPTGARGLKVLPGGADVQAHAAAVKAPEAAPLAKLPQFGSSGTAKVDSQVPLEAYSGQQRSFFGQLLDRWK